MKLMKSIVLKSNPIPIRSNKMMIALVIVPHSILAALA
jgi:hypothetical protein